MYRRPANPLRKAITRHEGLFRAALVAIVLTSLMWLVFSTGYQYAASSSPFWDEFITLWSARRITEGAMSPLQWGPGADALLFRDLEALVLRIFGFDVFVGRVPSILISVVTIPVLFYVGKRMFSVPAGLFACALMTLNPELVLWGARARSYSLLLLLTVLSTFLFYRWMIEPDDGDQISQRRGCLLVACYAVALLTHLEAILLLPGFALSALTRRGPGVFARKWVLFDFLACGAGVIAVLALFLHGETIPGAVPLSQEVWAGFGHIYLGIKNLGVFSKLLRRTPGGFVLLLFALGGLSYLIARALHRTPRRWEPSGEQAAPLEEGPGILSLTHTDKQNEGLMLLYVLSLSAAGIIILLLGPGWGGEVRYVLFLLPIFSLVVGATAVRFLGFLVERAGVCGEAFQRWLVLGLVLAGVGFMGVAPITDKQRFRQEWGYDLAFEYVADHWREGDVVVTVAPVACLVSLEQCDYIAIQTAYETYALEEDGRLVEAVTRLPLIMTVQEMEEVLDEHEQVWFVTDEGRLLSRYNLDFVQLIWDRMEVASNERGALVFRSMEQEEPSIRRVMDWNLEDKFRLRGCDLNRRTFAAGEELKLTLYWQGIEYANYFGLDYSVFVHLVDRETRLWAQTDGHPVAGSYPTSHWRSTEVVIPDRRSMLLPADIPPGRYRLEVGMYLLPTGERLQVRDQSRGSIGHRVIVDYVKVGDRYDDQRSPANPLGVNLGDSITMLGYDLAAATVEPGESMSLTLYWQALEEMQHDYTVFVHLVGQDGGIVSQDDGQPDGGFYPTSYWDKGEVVRDQHVLTVPAELGVGEYELRVGMYTLEDMHRLPVEGCGADQHWVVLTRIGVGDTSEPGRAGGLENA